MNLDLLAAQWPAIRDRLAIQFGLYLDESRATQGQNMVANRSLTLNLAPDAYAHLLLNESGAGELYRLAEQLANHETQFFRNPAHFRCLREHVFPTLQHERSRLRPIRCWSAGCATGEEAYSMAMVALQMWGAPPLRPVQIWGTDLSSTVLEHARHGVYRGRTLANIQPMYRSCFEPCADGSRVGTMARSLVQFEQHNLLDALPVWAQELDVVFCQNVTIYFQLATCKRLIERIYHALADGGYLLLGFSESLWGIFDQFETVEVEGAFIYRKTRNRVSRPARSSGTQPLVAQHAVGATKKEQPIRVVRSASVAPVGQTSVRAIETARALRMNGEQRAALTLLAQIDPDQRSPDVLALTAQLHADLGQREQAAAEARRALELDVMQDTAYIVLGMLDIERAAWDAASQHLERALYIVPHSPTVSFYLAESYRHQGRIAPAKREYRNTLRKLADVSPTVLLDGVAAGWLHSTCERWLVVLDSAAGS